MKKREVEDYIQDILEAFGEVEDFTTGMEFEDFVKDKKTINAVIRSLEVIGEATKKIPDSLREKYSKIPWNRMAGMRDKLIHTLIFKVSSKTRATKKAAHFTAYRLVCYRASISLLLLVLPDTYA